MLHRLEIENFYSVRERQILDLTVPATTPVDEKRFHAPAAGGNVRLPKVVVIFGANGSGKTTILRAASFLEDFVRTSFDDYKVGANINIRPFASAGWQDRPTFLAMEFSPIELLGNHGVYRYELEISRSDTSNFVSRESLSKSFNGGKMTPLFERVGDAERSEVRPTKAFQTRRNDPRLEVRPNVSVISSMVQFNHEPSKEVWEAFRVFNTNVIVDRFTMGEQWSSDFYVKFPLVLEQLRSRLRTIDVGISNVTFVERDGKNVPLFRHEGLDIPQDLYFESKGTKNFYCIFPLINQAAYFGAVAILDEVDSDIHPLLVPEIVRWVRESDDASGGQLIMTCHNATLLEDLVKEEVWFTEKSSDGATSLYGLSQIDGIRRDTNLYKKYLGGVFGAVPKVG